MNAKAQSPQLVDSQGRVFPLRGRAIQIGRGSNNWIVLQDAQVSRVHATVYFQSGQLFLRDEHSTNGTLLNGQKVDRAVLLNPGDRIKIGASEFVVESGSAPGGYGVQMQRSSALPFAIIGITGAVAVIFIIIIFTLNQSRATPSSIASGPISTGVSSPEPSAAPHDIPSTTSEPINEPMFPPPLADVNFPSKVIAYPSDWPVELRYPDQFKLVAAGSGIMPPTGNKGWVAELIYVGSPVNAKISLTAFFSGKGWQTAERARQDSNGFHLFVRRGSPPQTGTVLIGPENTNTGNSKILVIVIL